MEFQLTLGDVLIFELRSWRKQQKSHLWFLFPYLFFLSKGLCLNEEIRMTLELSFLPFCRLSLGRTPVESLWVLLSWPSMGQWWAVSFFESCFVVLTLLPSCFSIPLPLKEISVVEVLISIWASAFHNQVENLEHISGIEVFDRLTRQRTKNTLSKLFATCCILPEKRICSYCFQTSTFPFCHKCVHFQVLSKRKRFCLLKFLQTLKNASFVDWKFGCFLKNASPEEIITPEWLRWQDINFWVSQEVFLDISEVKDREFQKCHDTQNKKMWKISTFNP